MVTSQLKYLVGVAIVLAVAVPTWRVIGHRLAQLVQLPNGSYPIADGYMNPLPSVAFNSVTETFHIQLIDKGKSKMVALKQSRVQIVPTISVLRLVNKNQSYTLYIPKSDKITTIGQGDSLGSSFLVGLFAGHLLSH